MVNDELNGFLHAYRNGKTADVIQFDNGEGWGALFTLPPASPAAMARVGSQFVRLSAKRLRYVRQALLRRQDGSKYSVVIMTTLPPREQQVYDLSTGERISCKYLRDGALSSLEAAMGVDGECRS